MSPISASSVSSCSACSAESGFSVSVRVAIASTRMPPAAMDAACCSTRAASMGTIASALRMVVQPGTTRSGAPLVHTMKRWSWRCTVVMRARADENGTSPTRGQCASSAPLFTPTSAPARTRAVSVGSPTSTPSAPTVTSVHRVMTSDSGVRSCAGGCDSVHAVPSPSTTVSTCMRFSVSVPVLSVQMYVTEPSVSTAGRRRIKACCFTMRRAPSAREIATTAGSASGIAATARLSAVMNISSTGSPRSSPAAKMMVQSATTAIASLRPSTARRCWSGDGDSGSSRSMAAMRPSSVRMPVATTTPAPRPVTTVVPLKLMHD